MIGIETKCIPATNTRPRRICAFTCNGHRVVVPYDSDCSDLEAHFRAAQWLIATHMRDVPDCSTMAYGGTKFGYLFCWTQSTITSR